MRGEGGYNNKQTINTKDIMDTRWGGGGGTLGGEGEEKKRGND